MSEDNISLYHTMKEYSEKQSSDELEQGSKRKKRRTSKQEDPETDDKSFRTLQTSSTSSCIDEEVKVVPVRKSKEKNIEEIGSPNSEECDSQKSEDDCNLQTEFNELLIKFFVRHMLPFSILSRREGCDQFFQLIKLCNPAMSALLPTPQQIGKNVCLYFQSIKQRVQETISATLKDSFGTLILDWWHASNKRSVINILLSVTGAEQVRKTFFLKSLYIGSKVCDEAYYAKLVEAAMSGFADMKRVCTVVGDNNNLCVKVKESVLKSHSHMNSVGDQTHLANLLMEEIGNLVWVKQILSMVSIVIGEFRNHYKLYERFKQLKTQFNLQAVSNRSSLGSDRYGRVKLPPTAILPVIMTDTGSASLESVVAFFLRSKAVLLSLIACPDFSSNLYGDQTPETQNLFKATIRDESLYEKLLDMYHVLRLVRQYSRFFDDESSLLSEVYPATMQLVTKIKQLPLTSYYTAQRRAEVIKVFESRLHGEGTKTALVTPLHRVAYVLDPRSVRENITEFRPHLINQVISFVRSDCFPASEKLVCEGGEDEAVVRICQEFVAVRSSWRSQVQDPFLRMSLMMYNRSPVNYWMDYDQSSRLREFALRLLCCSPSSSSVERSLSVQARIRLFTQSRLLQDIVSKQMFCAFNESLLQSRARAVHKLNTVDYATLRFGTASEAIHANDGAERSSGQLYSKFLDDERVTCEIAEDEKDETDLVDLEVMESHLAAILENV